MQPGMELTTICLGHHAASLDSFLSIPWGCFYTLPGRAASCDAGLEAKAFPGSWGAPAGCRIQRSHGALGGAPAQPNALGRARRRRFRTG